MSFWNFLGTLIAGAILASIVVAVLSIDSIVDWFREQLGHGHSNHNRLAVTVLQNLKHGDYKVVQGIFNSASGEYESQRVVEASQIDQQFLAAHNSDGIAVWEV